MEKARNIVVLDGVCNLCNAGVNFIVNRDPKRLFYFTTMQSHHAQELIEKHRGNSFQFDTFLLIKDEVTFERSDGVLEIIKDLSGYWFLFGILRLIPRPIRDAVYKAIAKNRYRIFGKKDQCMVPSKEMQSRFIGS